MTTLSPEEKKGKLSLRLMGGKRELGDPQTSL